MVKMREKDGESDEGFHRQEPRVEDSEDERKGG